jgi:hypothetical protein
VNPLAIEGVLQPGANTCQYEFSGKIIFVLKTENDLYNKNRIWLSACPERASGRLHTIKMLNNKKF